MPKSETMSVNIIVEKYQFKKNETIAWVQYNKINACWHSMMQSNDSKTIYQINCTMMLHYKIHFLSNSIFKKWLLHDFHM